MNVERMRRYVQRTGYYAETVDPLTSEFAMVDVTAVLATGFRSSIWPQAEGKIAKGEPVAFRRGRVIGIGGMTGHDLIRLAERELRDTL